MNVIDPGILYRNPSDPQAVWEQTRQKFHAFDPNPEAPNYADRITLLLESMRLHEDMILKTLEAGGNTHNFDDVFKKILTGNLMWWDLGDTFMITEFHNYPRCTFFHIFMAGGATKTLLSVQKEIGAAVRGLGCTYMSISGRMGWLRRLKDEGWEPYLAEMRYDLTKGHDHVGR